MKNTLKTLAVIAALTLMLLSMTACDIAAASVDGFRQTLTSLKKVEIDITEGLAVEFTGANGSGHARIVYPDSDDTPPYIDKLLEAQVLDAQDLSGWLMLGSAITCEVEPSQGLSNGDTVTVTVDVDEAVLENMGVAGEDTELTFTVTGLTEVIVIHPFEGFQVSFSGVSPSASANFENRRSVGGVDVYYRIEEPAPYRDGQTLTVKAAIDSSDYYILAEDTLQITVSGVDKYITDGSELQPETLNAMRSKADSIVTGQIESWEGYFHYYGFDFVGYEFWSRHEDTLMGNVNAVYLYYRLNASDASGDFPIYYYVSFENVLQYVDGTQEVNLEKYREPSTVGLYELLKDYDTLETRTSETAGKYGSAYYIEKHFD